MHLLDTNIIIGILREKENIIKRYKKISGKKQPICLTTYSLSEIYLGFHAQEFKKQAAEKLKLQKELFDRMVIKLQGQNRITSLSAEDSKILGELFHLLKVKGNPIPVIDAIIGAIAISRELTVITTDLNHFKVIKNIYENFKVEFW